MANSRPTLVEKINRDLLECGICLDRYKEPRGLPCLHCFCHDCLDRYSKQQREISCPNCNKLTTIPKEGVAGFPAHFMVNTLQETLDMEKLKLDENMNTPLCNNCSLPDRQATVHCLDCNESFCQTCHTSHNSFTAMQNHTIVTIQEFQTGTMAPTLTASQDQRCQDHDGELKKFYCDTCKKPVCRDCIVMRKYCRDHDCISLSEASVKQTARLSQLVKQGTDLKSEYQTGIERTQVVEEKLSTSLTTAEKKLNAVQIQYKKQVDAVFDKHRLELRKAKESQRLKLYQRKTELQSSLAKAETACELASRIIQTGSKYEIASMFSSLTTSLEKLSLSTNSNPVDDMMGCLAVQEVGNVTVPNIVGVLRGERWKLVGGFSTFPDVMYPCGIAIHPYGDISITRNDWSNVRDAKVYSKSGQLRGTFKGPFSAHLSDVAITPDNRCILPGNGEILFYDCHGNWLKYRKAVTYDTSDRMSNPKALTVDSKGRIIAALSWGNTISIHHADGNFISKFSTPDTPWWIAVTSKDTLVVAFLNSNALHIMNYHDETIGVVQPPEGVDRWEPFSVCCSKQGELFVVNWSDKSVYRYTADGDQCLGCVIKGLDNPPGIAVSDDGQELYVTEWSQHVVKIFQRQ